MICSSLTGVSLGRSIFNVKTYPPGAREYFVSPVVLPPRDKLVPGILKIEDVITAYNQRLLKDQTFRVRV